jgi:hypothetical protein
VRNDEVELAKDVAVLKKQMEHIIGNGQPGALQELRKWMILSVVLSALALGTRAIEIGQALLKH